MGNAIVIVGTTSSLRCLASENKRNAPKRIPSHEKLTRWAFRTRHKCSVLVVGLFAASTAIAASFPAPGRASVLSGRARMALPRRSRCLAPLFRKQVIVSACNRLAGTDSGPADQSPKNESIFQIEQYGPIWNNINFRIVVNKLPLLLVFFM